MKSEADGAIPHALNRFRGDAPVMEMGPARPAGKARTARAVILAGAPDLFQDRAAKGCLRGFVVAHEVLPQAVIDRALVVSAAGNLSE